MTALASMTDPIPVKSTEPPTASENLPLNKTSWHSTCSDEHEGTSQRCASQCGRAFLRPSYMLAETGRASGRVLVAYAQCIT